ncbi:MAG TPA: shikimate dehydrogenase, partial [Pseudomonadales bacterium]|nr:shikimate dehydrogenase [Pseudomonadales bacterium]
MADGTTGGRDRTITGATRVLGLIADPVVQARSPAMANARLLEQRSFGAFVLVPMHVPAAGLADFVAALRHQRNFSGAIVSMPHKIAIATLIDELTPEARLVGAVNVIRRNPAGRITGTVLDGEGFVGGLLGAGHRVRDAVCLLAGAGGAASAVAFALAKHGCAALHLANRTPAKADVLAARIHSAFPHVAVTVGGTAPARIDISINGTSLGMQPGDALPLSTDVIDRSALVAECVIAPE